MKTVLIFLLVFSAIVSANAQNCSTCAERVQASLEKNATYQKLMDEGTQSASYEATKLLYQQLFASCDKCLGIADRQKIRETLVQADSVIYALKYDPNGLGLRFDVADEKTKLYMNTTQISLRRKQFGSSNITPVYPRVLKEK